MQRMLYYPNFEISDELFLKFALLYMDEIQPIIPHGAEVVLSDATRDIRRYTDLITPYSPSYDDGLVASIAAIQYLEAYLRNIDSHDKPSSRIRLENRDYILYRDKYTYEFEQYCLDNKLANECGEGICMSSQVAYIYMSILADVISKENGLEMITDCAKYAEPVLRGGVLRGSNYERMNKIRREIGFQVPVDMRRIPMCKFLELRNSPGFEVARRNFVNELASVMNQQDVDLDRVNMRDFLTCQHEIQMLLSEVFQLGASLVVSTSTVTNIIFDNATLENSREKLFGLLASACAVKQKASAIRDYVKRIEGKAQARRYLAKLNSFGLGI